MAQITCKKCGKTFDAPANDVKKIHCLYCGAPIKQEKKPKKRNKFLWIYILAGVLCVAAAVTLAITKPWEKKAEEYPAKNTAVVNREETDKSKIVAVSAGLYHTVGLTSDGTVVAVGDNDDNQCDVSDWTDIVAVSAGAPLRCTPLFPNRTERI